MGLQAAQGATTTTDREPQGDNMVPKGLQQQRLGSHREAIWCPGGYNNNGQGLHSEPQGSHSEPQGSHSEPQGSHSETKGTYRKIVDFCCKTIAICSKYETGPSETHENIKNLIGYIGVSGGTMASGAHCPRKPSNYGETQQ